MNKNKIARYFIIAFVVYLMIRIVAEPFLINFMAVSKIFNYINSVMVIILLLILSNLLYESKVVRRLFAGLIGVQLAIIAVQLSIPYKSSFNDISVIAIPALHSCEAILCFVVGLKIRLEYSSKEINSLGYAFKSYAIMNACVYVLELFIQATFFSNSNNPLVNTTSLILSSIIKIYLLYYVYNVFKSNKQETQSPKNCVISDNTLARVIVFIFMTIIVINGGLTPFIAELHWLERSFQLIDALFLFNILLLLTAFIHKRNIKGVPLIVLAIIQIIILMFSYAATFVQDPYKYFLYLAVLGVVFIEAVFDFICGLKLKSSTANISITKLGIAFMIYACVNTLIIIIDLVLSSFLYKNSTHSLVKVVLLISSYATELYWLFYIQKVFTLTNITTKKKKEKPKAIYDDIMLEDFDM